MASISTAASLTGATPAANSQGGTSAPAAAPASGNANSSAPAATEKPQDGFTQLLNEFLSPDGDSAQALPSQDLAALVIGSGKDAGLTDKSDTNAEGGDTEDAAALAVAAMLAGMAATMPAAAGSAAGGSATAGAGLQGADSIAALTTSSITLDVSKTAVDALTDGKDAAGNATAAAPATDSSAAAGQSPTNSAHMHALLGSNSASDVDATPDGALRAPVGTTAFKDELGTQLTWMAINGRETASLRLSPEHLGPLDIRISVNDGQASVWFGATNADTRSALEQSLPRLREMFASQGMVLADAGVSRDPSRNQFKPQTFTSGSRGSSDAGVEQSVTSITLARAGLIDTYV